MIVDSEPAGSGAAVDIFVGTADGEIGAGPGLIDHSKAVVAIEDDAAAVLVGFGDDAVEFGEDLAGGEVDNAENEEVGLGESGDEIVGVEEGDWAV